MRKTVILWMLTATFSLSAQTTKDSTRVKVGYGREEIKTIGGAVDKITEERMNKGLVNSSIEALSGQSAGVTVLSGINQEAMLSAVRVRGTTSLTGGNDPLVIIDGVQSDLTMLYSIYPADIESFTILKDASETAQYGSRGASGVIEVATKRGKKGRFHISYSGNIGFESIYKNIEMLNASEFRSAAQNLGLSIIDKGYDTDFAKSPTRTGYVQNHHIAFGGGTEAANYRVSIGYQDHNTVIKNNRFRNYLAKIDVTQLAFDNHLTVDVGVFGSLQKDDYIPVPQHLFYSAATFNPTFPDGTNENGGFDQIPEALWISNPNSVLKVQDDANNAHFNAHLKAKINLGYGLTLRAFGSFSYNNIHSGHYYPTYVFSDGEAYRREMKSEEELGNLSLNWIKTLGQHDIDVMFLAEARRKAQKGFYATVTDFSTDAFGYDNLSAGGIRPWGGTNSFYTDTHMESFLFRAKYTYKNRYTVTVNARTDASSKVGKNHRWGFFPSISAAWNINEEPFMKSVTWLNKLKLRMGYGKSGNLGGIDSYLSQELVQPNGVVNVEGQPTTTLGIIRNANPDLRWEIKRTFNVGLNMAFWDNRIVLSADYYTSNTSDLLYNYNVPVPPYTYGKLLANIGKMHNHGIEIGFGITPIRQKDMVLSINMNWSFQRNELVTLNGDFNGYYLTAPSSKGISYLYGAGFHGSSTVCYQMIGEPLGVFRLPHCKGLITNSDGTKEYDVTDEKYVCGQATPKATMGSNIAFKYRQWDITVQMNGAFGHKIYNGTALSYMNMASLPNYNVMKGAPEMNIHDQTISDYWLESGDYVNIDYITIGWDVPIRSRYIQSLRLSCSIDNVATITSYSGLTPMINSTIMNSSLGIDDKRSYPVYRSYSMGINITF